MAAVVTNNAWGVLAVPASKSATRILLSPGQGDRFPGVARGVTWFYATVVDVENNIEIIKCVSRNGDTLDVVRGVDNTFAREWPAQSRLELRPVAALFNDLANKDEVKAQLEEIERAYKDADSTDMQSVQQMLKDAKAASDKTYATKTELKEEIKKITGDSTESYLTKEEAKKEYVPIKGGKMTGSLSMESETAAGITVLGGDINVESKLVGVSSTPTGGNMTASGTIKAKSFRSMSDIRLKSEVAPLNPELALATALRLNPVSFTWNSTAERDIGFIAQEVAEELPAIVKAGEDGLLSISYQGFIPVAIAAIQSLAQRMAELEQKLEESK